MQPHQMLEAKTDTAALIAFALAFGGVRSNPHPQGRSFVVLPNADGSMRAEYLERPELPERRSGSLAVATVESFIEAVNRLRVPEQTIIYAALNPIAFAAVLNDHQAAGGANGWRDHRVTFKPEHSQEYLTWKMTDGKRLSQGEFAMFIENNMPDFTNPPGAKMLDIAINIKAKQSVSFNSAVRLQNGSVDLSYIEKTDGNAGATGKLQIPERFSIKVPVWAGLEQKSYAIDAFLRYRIKDGDLAIWYDLQRPHKVVEQAFADLVETIKKGITKTPVLFGNG